jgi:uncharacterized protein YecT (DUF1311 family)
MGSVVGKSLRVVCLLAALTAASVVPQALIGGQWNSARAEPADAEKDAFEAAKELGTVEAWDAFLSNYPTGFRADLARAYVKKLAQEPAAPPASQPAASGGDEQPSWCSSPNNPTERTICGDADLSSLDNVLNVAYGRAKHDSPNSLKDIEYVQKHWLLGQRNLCGTDVACLRKRYNEQIQILEGYFGN